MNDKENSIGCGARRISVRRGGDRTGIKIALGNRSHRGQAEVDDDLSILRARAMQQKAHGGKIIGASKHT